MAKEFHVLVINPGSTSTKFGLYKNETEVFSENLSHSAEQIAKYKNIADQYEFREQIIRESLERNNFNIKDIDAVVGRGGLLKPIPSGVYKINSSMQEDLKKAKYGEHASNLGALIAQAIAENAGCDAFIADPVVVDEMAEVARISGNPKLPRISIFHALNQKSVARVAAKQLGKPYDKLNLIVAHLGGGISVGVHENGRVVDVNNALDGDGPFSPERSGGVPVGGMVKLCFSEKYSLGEIKQQIKGKGGLVAYLGSNDAREIQNRVESGDEKARLIYEAMGYQISKEIGQLAAVVAGKVDAIVLTGGLAYDEMLMSRISDRVKFIAKVMVIPGEKELEALRDGGLRVLNKEETPQQYQN